MRRRILFVDDDPILRKTIQPHLEKQHEHFTTVMAKDGFEAVKQLQLAPFSLVVCDLVMPRMDGISLIQHLRDNYPDIPRIIASGVAIEKIGNVANAPDILAFLSKPYRPEALCSLILNTLRREAEGGIMYDVSPAVFLQFVEMDARTCSIRVLDKRGKHGGILYFIDGELVDARIDDLRGMEAALKFFTWPTATLFIGNDCPPRPNTINSSLQPIIMKAAGMRDEDESAIDEGEDGEDRPIVEPAADHLVPPEAELEPSLVRLLHDHLGHACQAEDIEQSGAISAAVKQLQLLGENSGFGDFHLGRLDDGRQIGVLVPGPPPALLHLPKATANRLLAFLEEKER